MAKSKELSDFLYTAEDAPIRVRFGKVEREFANAAELRAEAALVTEEAMERLLIALLIEQEPDLGQVRGKHRRKALSVDFSKANWGEFK